jgi:hypothetical protein
MSNKILPMTFQVVAASDIASDEFLDRLADKVAEKMLARAEKASTEELTDKQAAAILRKSVSTVRRMKKDGTIPSMQKGGVRVIRLCDILSVEK